MGRGRKYITRRDPTSSIRPTNTTDNPGKQYNHRKKSNLIHPPRKVGISRETHLFDHQPKRRGDLMREEVDLIHKTSRGKFLLRSTERTRRGGIIFAKGEWREFWGVTGPQKQYPGVEPKKREFLSTQPDLPAHPRF